MAAKVDPITLDIIENALKNARFEMDGVVVRISLSPVIREQHDEFPMICNERGQMIVGQFGSYIPAIVEKFEGDVNEGDIFVWNDPYACKGSISHNNDWCVMMPIFHEEVLVGFSSIFGHMVDVGGKVPGSMPSDARTHLGRGPAHSAGADLRQGHAQQGRPRHHAQQLAYAGHEPRRPDGADRRLPHRLDARARALRPFRPRNLYGRVRHAARPHPRSHEGADRQIHLRSSRFPSPTTSTTTAAATARSR